VKRKNKLRLNVKPSSRPLDIEFDQSIGAWYVRFRKARIAKTISEEKRGFIAAIDLDEDNEVVGLELIGPMEFSLEWLKKVSPVDVSKIDFDRARFRSAAYREAVGIS
jgi:hypothetical protein